MENLTLDPDKQLLLINLEHSKTDQVGKGTILQIGKSEGVACPFKLVEKYLSVRPLTAGPLFVTLIRPRSQDTSLRQYSQKQ